MVTCCWDGNGIPLIGGNGDCAISLWAPSHPHVTSQHSHSPFNLITEQRSHHLHTHTYLHSNYILYVRSPVWIQQATDRFTQSRLTYPLPLLLTLYFILQEWRYLYNPHWVSPFLFWFRNFTLLTISNRETMQLWLEKPLIVVFTSFTYWDDWRVCVSVRSCDQ